MFFASREPHSPSRRTFLRWTAAAALSPAIARAACPCNDDINAPQDANASATQPDNLLRVCTDPNNFPFSNRAHAGFEDKIACLIAGDLGLVLQFDFLPQRLGFYRTAFKTFNSNIAMAAPAGFDKALITRPYYRSTYVFVHRSDKAAPTSLDDAALRSMKIGVQLAGSDTPVTHAMARRKLIDNLVGFPVFDETAGKPAEKIVSAVASGEIDLALAWGPQVGYFARNAAKPLRVTPITPAVDGKGAAAMPFAFDICMAVNRADKPLVEKLNKVIAARQKDIDAILDGYAVPRLPVSSAAETRKG